MAAPSDSNVYLLNGRRKPTGGGEIMPSPAEPMAVARVLLADHTDHDGYTTLRRWRGDWWSFNGPHWVATDPEVIRRWIYEATEHAEYETINKRTQQTEYKPWSPNKGKVDQVIDAMAAPTLLDRDLDAPSWLSTGQPATGYVPCRNGLVDVDTQQIHPATPDYFGTTAIPLDFDPDAGEPTEWLTFLRSLWPDDDGEIAALQQWMGYVLSGRTELQKMLLMVGPPRCGKGTIARILQELVGKANTSAPTLAMMAQNFGLTDTIGKSLAIVGDARLASQGQETVVERLLSISGQDALTIDRKNRTAWTGTMTARVMILSNELPRFLDAAGAIASRFVILKLRRSFLGAEDTRLEGRLLGELPAILKWALDGLRDLDAAGRIVPPASHDEAMQELRNLVSPIGAFLDDVCDAADDERMVPFSELYREYTKWATENGRGAKNTAGFSSDLKTALPGVKTDYRPRDADGKRMPRHVQGVTISPEWLTRARESTENWRTGGSW